MKKEKKKVRIYKDPAKDRHTTHWDMDYLTRKEVEDLHTKSTNKPTNLKDDSDENPMRLGLILLIAGLLGLGLALFLVRIYRG